MRTGPVRDICLILLVLALFNDGVMSTTGNSTFSDSGPPLLSKCTYHEDCPGNASCKERFPDGLVCYCDSGYMTSLGHHSCETAVGLGEPCITRCRGINVVCNNMTNRCECETDTMSADGINCAPKGTALLNQTCGNDFKCTSLKHACEGGVCVCNNRSRPATDEEKRAFNNEGLQCRGKSYSLGMGGDQAKTGRPVEVNIGLTVGSVIGGIAIISMGLAIIYLGIWYRRLKTEPDPPAVRNVYDDVNPDLHSDVTTYQGLDVTNSVSLESASRSSGLYESTTETCYQNNISEKEPRNYENLVA